MLKSFWYVAADIIIMVTYMPPAEGEKEANGTNGGQVLGSGPEGDAGIPPIQK